MLKAGARFSLTLLGYLTSVGLPLAATLSCFPLWRARGTEAVISGVAVLLCALCALPLWRGIRALLRSPSVWGLWLFLLLAFTLIGSIVREMCMICFFGLIGNLIASVLFRLARKRGGGHGA